MKKNIKAKKQKEQLLKNPLKYDMNLVQKVAAMLEASNIEDFLDIRSRPLRLMFWNLMIGLFRGIGFFIGATVAGAVVYVLMKNALHSLGGLPWIGEKIASAVIYIGDLVKQGATGK